MNEERLKTVIIVLVSSFMLVFCLLPFVYMAVTSLSLRPDFLSQQSRFEFTLSNYLSILTVPSLHFLDYLRNSLLVSAISAVLTVLIAALAAYSITRLALPGKVFVLFFVLAVSMFPQISLVSYLFKLMSQL
ncbi:MAG: carbohydrate ABC transporter permease, partial [bacterium]